MATLFLSELQDQTTSLIFMATCSDRLFDSSGFYGFILLLAAVPNITLPFVTIIMDVKIVKILEKIVPTEGNGDDQDVDKIISIPIKATLFSAVIILLSMVIFLISVMIQEPKTKTLVLALTVFVVNMVRAPLILNMTYKLAQERDEEQARQEARSALQQREIDEARKKRQRQALGVTDIEAHM